MTALIARLGELGSWLAGASLLLMMLIGAIDIIGAKLLNRPLPAALETTEALMVLGVFLALAYTQAHRQHIVVDLLTTRLGPGARRALDGLAQLLTLGVFGLVAWQGWVLGLTSLHIREYASGILPFPLYPSKLALAVGATLMVLQLLVDIRATVGGGGTGASHPHA
jgi:TRAP-type C4-dicarboxylate transport system permease small subunit